MHRTWWQRLPLFMPDDGAAAAAQGQQSQGQQQAAQGAAQQGGQGAQSLADVAAQQAAAAAAAAQVAQHGAQGQQQQVDPNAGKFILKDRPEWLPEGFHDKATGEVKVEALARNAADLKAKLSTGTHKPPANAEGYAIDFSKETDAGIKAAAAAFIVPGEDGSPDPILAAVQADAFKEWVSVHAFQTVVRSYLKHQAGALPAPFDEKAEMAKLGQHGPALLKNLLDFADGEVKHGKWTDDDMARFRNYLYDADDARFLQKLLHDAGRIPEIQVAALTQAATTEDASALDAELASINAKLAKREITEAQAQQMFEANQEKRAKLYGKDPQRAWPPPAA